MTTTATATATMQPQPEWTPMLDAAEFTVRREAGPTSGDCRHRNGYAPTMTDTLTPRACKTCGNFKTDPEPGTRFVTLDLGFKRQVNGQWESMPPGSYPVCLCDDDGTLTAL